MTSESAEILAKALEHDASQQENNQISDIGMQWDNVYGEILPINEIPEELFGLAMQFWDDWGDAARHEWKYHEPFTESDWPRIARKIASHVREGTLPTDQTILREFMPKPKASLTQRIRKYFSD